MKEKVSAAWLFLAVLTTSLFFIFSCNSRNGSGPVARTDGPVYDTIYQKDGYILLHVPQDSVEFTDKFSGPIEDTIATRMIHYYLKKRRPDQFPITIDFDFSSVSNLMAQLERANPGEYEKKSVRIYLSAYDAPALTQLYPGTPNVQRRGKLLNYVTAILVGRYDGEEKTAAVNLGNICPPNCPDPPGIPEGRSSRLYEGAARRTDYP